ncbi:MAG: hypothetical protein M1817_001453 [Caeruleum heppii]|nr:MAG: hypothetical protein M1817_001453 [Caeruleum heppii]
MLPNLALALGAVALTSDIVLSSAAPTMSQKRAAGEIPAYVNDYAPLIYLHSSDKNSPSDIAAQVANTKPQVNFKDVTGFPSPLTLDNLDSLNALGGKDVYLTVSTVYDPSADPQPAWLEGVAPDATGKINGAVPCAVIVNDKGNGVVDAFYMYFWAWNRGPKIFGQDIGDHVGDWEHIMIRFQDGKPQALWYSQHARGQAFTYAAVEKKGIRPVGYAALGSHAIYGTAGVGRDKRDAGKLWDPVLSAYRYTYCADTKTFTPAPGTSSVAWLNFLGRWGDKKYPKGDPRQRFLLGIDESAKISDGPTGPIDKELDRTEVCPSGDSCTVLPILTP